VVRQVLDKKQSFLNAESFACSDYIIIRESRYCDSLPDYHGPEVELDQHREVSQNIQEYQCIQLVRVKQHDFEPELHSAIQLRMEA
jgi:hypothetical protein